MQSEPAEWNYLFYMAADNNLERFAIDDIIEMKKVGSNANVNILVLLDRSPGYDKRYGNWSDTRLLRISRNTNFESLDHDVVKNFGELDMTNPVNLQNFLLYANTHYKAEKTALVLWSHGTGVYPEGLFMDDPANTTSTLQVVSNDNPSLAIVHDYSTGYDYSDAIFLQNLADILGSVYNLTGKKLDILQFDACLMQMNEVIWQLAELVDYIVGSQPDMPGQGNNYETVLQYFTSSTTLNAMDIAVHLTESYYNEYQNLNVGTGYSAVSTLTGWSDYKNSFKTWINTLLEADSTELEELLKLRQKMSAYQMNYPEYVDILFFLQSVMENKTFSSTILSATDNLIDAMKHSILSNRTTQGFTGKLHGIGINFPGTIEQANYYFPSQATMVNKPLKFLQDTNWQKFINKINDF